MKLFNKIGIIIAIFFGIILLLVSAKENSTYVVKPELNMKNLINKSDQIKPSDLNEWIIEKNQNYLLIDIRTEKEFDEGSIPTAENIPMKDLVKWDTVSDLPKDRPIIIFSNNDSNAIQGRMIFMKTGHKVFLLEGGYDYWKKYPSKPVESLTEEELLIYKKNLSAANSLKGIQSDDMTESDLKPVKKIKSKKKKRKKKNKLEGC